MERARTDWLDSLGLPPRSLSEQGGVIFVVRSVEMEFLTPARLNDRLRVSVELESLGAASIRLMQRIVRDADQVASGRFRIACLDVADFRICRVPRELSERLAKWKI